MCVACFFYKYKYIYLFKTNDILRMRYSFNRHALNVCHNCFCETREIIHIHCRQKKSCPCHEKNGQPILENFTRMKVKRLVYNFIKLGYHHNTI